MKTRKPAQAPLFNPGDLGLATEEDVKIKFLVPYLERLGYKQDCIDYNKAIEVQEGRKQKTIFADVVVYTSKAKQTPLIVCETKPPSEVLTRTTREQAISYARLLPRIAPLALITNGLQTQVFQTLSKHRLQELPPRQKLAADFVNFVVSQTVQDALRLEAKHELFIIDDVQSFKSILKACHDEIRNNEGYDPATAFDEMSKVLFCKMYEEKKNPDTNRFRLGVFDDALRRLSINVVIQIFEETKADARYVGLFEPDSQIALHDRTIRKIVSLFEGYDLSLTSFDVKGEAFEFFLGETFTGGLGEYFTPRNVVEFMVDAINPKVGHRIVDPFCGTGGFLIYAFEVVSEKIRLQDFSDEEKERWKIELSNRSLYGTDWKERTSLACKMNMTVHGDGSAGIFMHHGLVDVPGAIEEGQFDICLTNPPFGSYENDPDILGAYELGAGRKKQDRVVLAVERAMRLVKPGGVVAIVVIDGILNTQRAERVRDYIRQNSVVRGVVSLTKATFEGYNARAKTSVLFLQRKEVTATVQGPCFMAVVQNSGYAANGAPVPGNELPDVLLDYKAFLAGAKLTAHPNSWVCIPDERLDAEYYWPRTIGPRPQHEDVTQLVEGTSASASVLADELALIASGISEAFKDLGTKPRRLSEILELVSDKVRVEREATYRLLGVRWWGGGTFIREEKQGKQVSATSLNRVHAGWLVYNRLFAFRGSFAVVMDEHDGALASNEFPTFRVRDDVDNPEAMLRYVLHTLNSPQYLMEVDKKSTGSTKVSRNRFKEDRLLESIIQVPIDENKISRIVDLLDRLHVVKAQQQALVDLAKKVVEQVGALLPT